jgi:hypothetical protein
MCLLVMCLLVTMQFTVVLSKYKHGQTVWITFPPTDSTQKQLLDTAIGFVMSHSHSVNAGYACVHVKITSGTSPKLVSRHFALVRDDVVVLERPLSELAQRKRNKIRTFIWSSDCVPMKLIYPAPPA